MLLRVEMKFHCRSVCFTSIGHHSEKNLAETSERMRSKFLHKLRKWRPLFLRSHLVASFRIVRTIHFQSISSQSCRWVHFLWRDPTRPIIWLTQPNPTQCKSKNLDPAQPIINNNQLTA